MRLSPDRMHLNRIGETKMLVERQNFFCKECKRYRLKIVNFANRSASDLNTVLCALSDPYKSIDVLCFFFSYFFMFVDATMLLNERRTRSYSVAHVQLNVCDARDTAESLRCSRTFATLAKLANTCDAH